MKNIDHLLKKETDLETKYKEFLESIKILEKAQGNKSYIGMINEMIPVIEKNVNTFECQKQFLQEELQEYVNIYHNFVAEVMKYQVGLIGDPKDCYIVKQILDYSKVHCCAESSEPFKDDEDFDYIIVCSAIDQEKLAHYKRADIIRYDILRFFAYQISPESAYLDLNLRQKIENGCEGAITGLSYEHRGINYEKLNRPLACLAAPSQDLFLDYHNFMWFYDEVAVKRGRPVKYCVIGMDFYHLWYDMSLSSETELRMLIFYRRIQRIHHFHKMDNWLLKYKEDLKVCKELMVNNYMDVDYQNSFHPELVQWDRTEEYEITDSVYKRDREEVKKVFDKPYPMTFKENMGILERFMKFLYLHNIKVLVYIPPFPDIFNEFTSVEMRETTLKVLTQMKEKFGFELLDLSNDERFTDHYFADWCHLNCKGADLATGLLNNYMEKNLGGV